jgi:hypothetical protein
MSQKGKSMKETSNVRIAVWIIAAGVGLYLLGSGVVGILIAA